MYKNFTTIQYKNYNYIYNLKTGLFFETSPESIPLLLDDAFSAKYPEAHEYMIQNYYLQKEQGNNFLSQYYPKVTPSSIWNNEYLVVLFCGNYRILKINTNIQKILNLCNGENSLSDICKKLRLELSRVIKKLLKFVDFSNQVIKMFKEPYCETDDFVYFNVFKECDEGYSETVRKENKKYHQAILDATLQFEEKETTVSYLLRKKSSLLRHKTYGEQFCDIVLSLYSGEINPIKILEIGGGIGDFAYSFNERIFSKTQNYNYELLDMSSELSASQKQKCNNKDFINNMNFSIGDAESYCFGKEKFDIVILNEVIADFSITPFDKKSGFDAKVDSILDKYEVRDCIIKDTCINTGAILFIEKLSKIIKKEGIVVLVEFTESDESSQITRYIRDHTEASINFSILKKVAQKNGFKSKIMNLGDFLQIETSSLVLAPTSFYLLRALCSCYHMQIDKLLHEKSSIESLFKVNNLQYISVDSIISFFKVLILTK